MNDTPQGDGNNVVAATDNLFIVENKNEWYSARRRKQNQFFHWNDFLIQFIRMNDTPQGDGNSSDKLSKVLGAYNV